MAGLRVIQVKLRPSRAIREPHYFSTITHQAYIGGVPKRIEFKSRLRGFLNHLRRGRCCQINAKHYRLFPARRTRQDKGLIVTLAPAQNGGPARWPAQLRVTLGQLNERSLPALKIEQKVFDPHGRTIAR